MEWEIKAEEVFRPTKIHKMTIPRSLGLQFYLLRRYLDHPKPARVSRGISWTELATSFMLYVHIIYMYIYIHIINTHTHIYIYYTYKCIQRGTQLPIRPPHGCGISNLSRVTKPPRNCHDPSEGNQKHRESSYKHCSAFTQTPVVPKNQKQGAKAYQAYASKHADTSQYPIHSSLTCATPDSHTIHDRIPFVTENHIKHAFITSRKATLIRYLIPSQVDVPK